MTKKGGGGVSPFSASAKQREAERRAKAVKVGEQVASQSATPAVAIAPLAETGLVGPDQAIESVQAIAPQLFVAMVEERRGLLDALRQLGVSSATFFTALDASQALRGWYRGVKAAQAVMDVEQVNDVLDAMTNDAADDLIGNAERNAKMTVARTKLEQARWAAQKLLPAMYGEKTQHESHSKVEIVVRRETKKAVKAAVEE